LFWEQDGSSDGFQTSPNKIEKVPAMKSQVSERLKEPVTQEVLDLIYQRRLDEDFVANFPMITLINRAHVIMLLHQSILTPETAKALLLACDEMERTGPTGHVPDPRLEDPYFNYEAAVVKIVGADTGGRIHIARSRNDLQATFQRLHCRNAALALSDRLHALIAILLERADQYADVVMPGYTHMQPAQPSTYGFYLLGLAEAFMRDSCRLDEVWPRINLNPLGAAAMTGTGFPIDRNLTASLLGFDGVIEHTQDCVASRDFALELLAICVQMAVTWSRLAQDVFTMVMNEFQTLELPDRVAGTSSIMPQKKNPVIMEHLKGKSAVVLGAYVAAATAMRATSFSNTIDGNRESLVMAWGTFRECCDCLKLTSLMVEAAQPNRARMLTLTEQNFSTATDLADAMVRDCGLSFRDAHHVVGAVVRMAMDRGLTANQITSELVDQAARDVLGRPLGMHAVTVMSSLDPTHAVAAHDTVGGPSPAEVRRRVAVMRHTLAAARTVQSGRYSRLAEADRRLHAAIRDVM
jgi:argininosuccinate lyase